MTAPLLERLYARLIIDPSGCLLWTGEIDKDGYGRFRVDGKRRRVHRLMYELLEAPISDGLHIDHLCRVRHCGNVAHMELVTNRENVLRGTGPTAVNAAKDCCIHGHPFDERNTLSYEVGHRHCRECTLAKHRQWWARRKARLAAQG